MHFFYVSLGVLALLLSAGAVAEESNAKQKMRPKFRTMRFDEDWSVFGDREASESVSFLDRLKWIPLSKDGSIGISFGGQLRERVEAWSNFQFGTPAGDSNDDVFFLSRVRYHADLRATERFRVFVEAKHAFASGRDLPGGRRAAEADEADLLNAFGEVSIPLGAAELVFRGGRQELLFGKQRLVTPLDWSNVRRSFDGFSGILSIGPWKLHGFWARPVSVRKFKFNKNDANTDFFGVDASRSLTLPCLGEVKLNPYWYGFYRDAAAFGSALGSEKRHTIGALLHSDAPNASFDYQAESALQVGRVGDAQIRAWMAVVDLGYTFIEAAMTPRVGVGFDYASGGRNTEDGVVATFNQLFPLGHSYLGYIDVVGRQNIIDVRPSVTVFPHEKLSLKLESHSFWRADTDDALYSPSGAVLRAGSSGSSSSIGTEIDFLAKYRANRHLEFTFGLSHFISGPFIEQSGPSEEISFAYLIAQWTF